ncbi:PglL family O-oligosaccharyltransferase [Marinobacter sp.]|uniref:PglL family O-oligosaccharyltransferase n=1 Tax=Marinobacter sp. TaxID=50741 RepID=UPI002B4AAA1D|nr:Wzy polymerase domain-containing protein [Marinobacter sp.]HKK55691.1 Wzy polymerase domain-containing protein [Marinobacter sp.]
MMATLLHDQRLANALIGSALVTFTLLLHIIFPNTGASGQTLPFNGAMWMGFFLMVALALWPVTHGKVQFSAFHQGVAMLLLAFWLPLFWSWNEASLVALPRLLGVTAGALLLFALAQPGLSRRHWWWLGMAILAGALLETALGYVQLYVLERTDPLSYLLGYDPLSGRPFGVFQHVNVMASFLASALVISAWLQGEARNRLEKAVILLAPLFMPVLILVIQSRTSWFAVLIAVPLVLIHLYKLDQARCREWGAALLVGCMLAAIAWWAPWAEESVAVKAVDKAGERLPVYLHSLRMILEAPFSGWGYGRFQHDFVHSFADWRAALPVNQPVVVDPLITATFFHPHNELLLWGVEGGLLPMLAMIGFGSWVIWRIWSHGPRGERLLMTVLPLPLVLHAMTEFPFYYSLGHWLAFLLILGMIADRCWPTREKTMGSGAPLRVGIIFAVPLLWGFMMTHLHALWQIKLVIDRQGRDISSLERIVNPLGIGYEIDYLQMNYDLHRKSPQAYREYKLWWLEASGKYPDRGLYENMLVLQRMHNDRNPVLSYEEAARLYPLIPAWLGR